MKATNDGKLNVIPDCEINISGAGKIPLKSLPNISDSKTAIYNSEGIVGRSFPLYTYSHSGDRNINISMHFYIVEKGDAEKNLEYLRMIQSAVYPQDGDPYFPPPICQIRCGQLLTRREPLCVVLQSYTTKFDPDVAWDEETYCPYKFSVDTSWLTVYTTSDLPYQNRIITSGR